MSPAEGTIRLLTWNIHGGVGTDRRCDLDRVLGIVEALNPDIAALQEVDGRVHLGRRPYAFERMSERLRGSIAEARLTGSGERAYGHMLWSRWPLGGAEIRHLPGGRIEPRAAIDAAVETPAGRLRILATHFGLVPADRRHQAAFLAGLRAEDPTTPTVALGDFNDWRLSGGSVHRRLAPVLPQHRTPATWPSLRPFVRMDRIYASAEIAILDARVCGEAARASDHLPLLVELRLPGG